MSSANESVREVSRASGFASSSHRVCSGVVEHLAWCGYVAAMGTQKQYYETYR